MKNIVLTLMLVALYCVTIQKAEACTCARVVVDGPTDPAAIEAMMAGTRKMYEERGGAVFTGEVVKIEKVKARMLNLPRSFQMKRVTVRVGKYWFGVQSPKVVIFTGIGDGDCGIPYVKGERYLFDAINIGGMLQTDICRNDKPSEFIFKWYDKVFGRAKEFAPKQQVSSHDEI